MTNNASHDRSCNVFRWLHKGSSNMAVLEVSLLTGFRPDIESLEMLLQHPHLKLKRYELDSRKIFFYFDEVGQSQYVTIHNCQHVFNEVGSGTLRGGGGVDNSRCTYFTYNKSRQKKWNNKNKKINKDMSDLIWLSLLEAEMLVF